MKRFHAHVRVADLTSSVRFYSLLFGVGPSVLKPDYAKWALDEPRVNFAISAGSSPGLDHLGLQVESDQELELIAQRLRAAGQTVASQQNASCCYARGNKGWLSDPGKISWEIFHTLGENAAYGSDAAPNPQDSTAPPESCCAPAAPSADACCSAIKES